MGLQESAGCPTKDDDIGVSSWNYLGRSTKKRKRELALRYLYLDPTSDHGCMQRMFEVKRIVELSAPI